MNRIAAMLVFGLWIAAMLVFGLLLLPLAFAQSCGVANDDQLIFRISDTTNAHAELWDQGNYLPPGGAEICYNTFFGNYTGANPHACDGSNELLRLNTVTNAHADSSGSYPEQVCFGDLQCTVKANCDAGETCIASISALTNAHVSSSCDPAAGGYGYKVCCSSAGPPVVGCTVSGVNPAAIKVYEGTTTVTVNYFNFSTDPEINPQLDCGDGGISGPISCPAGVGTGSCTFDCSNYNELASFEVVARLSDGVLYYVYYDCSANVYIFVYGTIVDVAPYTLVSGQSFEKATATVQRGPVGEYAPAEEPDSESVARLDDDDVYVRVRVYAQGLSWNNWNDGGSGRRIDHVEPFKLLGDGDATTFDFGSNLGFISAVQGLFVGNYALEVRTYETPNILLSQSPPINFTIIPGIPPIASRLKITQFNAQPLSFEAADENFGSIALRVKNLSPNPEEVSVKLEVLEPLTNKPMSPAISSQTDCGSIDPNAECQLDETDFAIDISALLRGSYKISATTWITGEPLAVHDQKALFFSIGRPAMVPDLGLFLVPAIALSVLAVVFLAGKKQA